MDDKDVTILRVLMDNARTPLTEIAKIIGITDVAVKKRVQKLERDGVIKKYTIVVEPKKIGYNGVALVGVDTEPDKVLSVAHELSKRDFVVSVFVTTGDHMIMAEVWARTGSDLMRIIEEIGGMEGVKKVCPAIVLERIK
ncbi:Lrp/AsnC family transcriptional regulator [Infirmifilum lucidum]|uniref:Lrp/AsnC family transcriptional regulator n=1 Tax=Infirmifilum lucidum TaxID=2776706 RepID=A0A7L9FHQ6_9CREN|nr:Lrp/AsnC family transcriptional regulator [Infirmifilum lucidum]QOJ78446.1 Lrp/AsnC family transcriptional regulator [Infirmifilum lucidum]